MVLQSANISEGLIKPGSVTGLARTHNNQTYITQLGGMMENSTLIPYIMYHRSPRDYQISTVPKCDYACISNNPNQISEISIIIQSRA